MPDFSFVIPEFATADALDNGVVQLQFFNEGGNDLAQIVLDVELAQLLAEQLRSALESLEGDTSPVEDLPPKSP